MTETLRNIEAEAALLGAMLIDNALAPDVLNLVAAEDFSLAAHNLIFERIDRLVTQGAKATPLTLRTALEGEPAITQVGGVKYLAKLTGDSSGLITSRQLASHVADLAARRRAIEALQNVDVALDEVVEQLRLHDAANGPAKRLPVIDFATLPDEPPPRRSIWGDWLPVRQTTLLTGEGGVGKSLLSQQLATCVALGEDFLGRATTKRPTLFLTCEDDQDELHRRQVAICEALGRPLESLRGKLHLVSLAGEDMVALAQFSTDGRMAATDRWRAICSMSREAEIGLAVLDNATDLLAGDHNDLHTVARFVNLLTGWAMAQDGAALLLHHPAKGGADWLGSVAWTNKVRNRLLVKRAGAGDPDSRVVESAKANYGRTGERVTFRWHRGAFVLDEDLPPSVRSELDEINGANATNQAFLSCLDIATARKQNVSHNRSTNYAPKAFAQMVEGKPWTPDDFAAAMERLLHLGLIELDADLWLGADRHPRRGIRRADRVS